MEELLSFLQDIKNQGFDFLIEAEARSRRMQSFINEYNNRYNCNISLESEGVILLDPTDDKWGLELRLYVPITPPRSLIPPFCKNNIYKAGFTYRLSNNDIIQDLFDNGLRLGNN